MARNSSKIGPYSKLLRRGALGKLADGRTELGRYIRHLEAELVAHVGGRPTITQKLLIERIIRTRLQVDLLDEKLADPGDTWTDIDRRTYSALLNAIRLSARELGFEPRVANTTPSLADYLEAKGSRSKRRIRLDVAAA